jgi:CDP-6-deoxy-D-xylo-4-hexulose-3-dehydrase
MEEKDIIMPLAVSSWDEQEREAINKVIESDNFTMGKNVNAFEKEFASYHGSKYCVMVNSGSSANHLGLSSLFFRKHGPKLTQGDEVLVTAVSWSTTYSPLYFHGLKLRFVDIDLDTLNVDTDKLIKAITPNTKAIFAVNLLGNPNVFSELQRIAEENDLLLLEDNCESLGAEYTGKKTGSFGLFGTCSGFFSHHMSTMEGGMITTDDEEIYHILLSIRAHGWTRNLPKSNKLTKKSDDNFLESFRFILPGYNFRPLEFSGSLGRVQLKKLNQFIKQRRINAELFQEMFEKYSFLRIQKEIGQSSWFGFSLVLDANSGISRESFVNFLTDHGIETRPIVAGNIIHNPMVEYFDYSISDDLGNADLVHNNGLFIGNHHFSLEEPLRKLDKIVKSNFGD